VCGALVTSTVDVCMLLLDVSTPFFVFLSLSLFCASSPTPHRHMTCPPTPNLCSSSPSSPCRASACVPWVSLGCRSLRRRPSLPQCRSTPGCWMIHTPATTRVRLRPSTASPRMAPPPPPRFTPQGQVEPSRRRRMRRHLRTRPCPAATPAAFTHQHRRSPLRRRFCRTSVRRLQPSTSKPAPSALRRSTPRRTLHSLHWLRSRELHR
jgi:hypothetical protein